MIFKYNFLLEMDEDNDPAEIPYEADPIDSEEEDEFPEFGNDENKKLF